MTKIWNGIPVTVNFEGPSIGIATAIQSSEGLTINFHITDPEWIEKLSLPDNAERSSYSLAGVSYYGQQTPRSG